MMLANSTGDTFEQISQLYVEHYAWLVKYLVCRMHNVADAEDCCQQVFLRLYEQPEGFDHIKNLRGYLTTMANRICIDHWRREKSTRKVIDTLSVHATFEFPFPEQSFSDEQALRIVIDQLSILPSKTSDIFIDSRINNLTGQQVALRRQVSLRTVRKHLNTASSLLVKNALQHVMPYGHSAGHCQV